MTRHILDKQSVRTGRIRAFAQIAHKSGPAGTHRSARALHSRPSLRRSSRLARYLRIDRGYLT